MMHRGFAIPLVLSGLLAVAPAALAQSNARDIELARGSRVEIQNADGSVTVTGTDSNKLDVRATYMDSGNPASFSIEDAGSSGGYTVTPSHDDDGDEGGSVRLEVRVPRETKLPSVDVGSGDVVVSGVHGEIRVTCGSGNVRVSDGGDVFVRASSGDVDVDGASGGAYIDASSGNVSARGVKGSLTFKAGSGNAVVENVGGAVDASLASGDFRLKSAGGPVRVDAISGNVELSSTGAINARSASGSIDAVGATGDVEIRSASGDANFTGEISSGHTYRLRSLSGNATMRLCGKVPGFTVTLRSYSGDIETDYPLKVDNPSLVSRGLTGRFGDGSADIQIEVQSGSAKILSCGDDKNPK